MNRVKRCREVIHVLLDAEINFETALHNADKAMYRAKHT